MPLPLFIFQDNNTKVDECIMHCCQSNNSQGNKNGNNIIIPKYGANGHTLEKIDKVFISKFKKMVKLIQN